MPLRARSAVEPTCAHGAVMTTSLLSPGSTGSAVPSADPLKIAVGAYLGRFKGSSREHTGSDLRVFLTWCGEHGVQPLATQRVDLERYVRWMQETRRFKPSTESRGRKPLPVPHGGLILVAARSRPELAGRHCAPRSVEACT